MIDNLSLPVLILIALAALCLFIVVKSFTLPKSHFKKEEEKEKLRKILERNREIQENS